MIISLIFGMLPDVLYYWSMLLAIKEKDKHKLIFFILIFVAYILLITICRYDYILYMLFGICIYVILKVLYKSDIIDLFLIIILFDYMMITSFASYFLFDNYILALIINRILLFMPLLICKKLNKWYNIYRSLWNRNANQRIKSLTLRNISILLLNTTIVLLYITLIISYKFMI
jgi:hypothetical protein